MTRHKKLVAVFLMILAGTLGACRDQASTEVRGDRESVSTEPASGPSGASHAATMDHPTFEGLGNLVAAADHIIVGEVTGQSGGAAVPLGSDAAGDDLGAFPFVYFTVSVNEVVAGDPVGGTISVAFPGGQAEGEVYEVSELSAPPFGIPLMFFLDYSSELDVYYALAGSHAIATPGEGGSWVLPAAALGEASAPFNIDDLMRATPDQLDLLLVSDRAVRVKGIPSSGGFDVVEDGSTTNITGIAVVDGSYVELNLTIESRKTVSGTAFVDGVDYPIFDGKIAKQNSQEIKITGRQGPGPRLQAITLNRGS